MNVTLIRFLGLLLACFLFCDQVNGSLRYEGEDESKEELVLDRGSDFAVGVGGNDQFYDDVQFQDSTDAPLPPGSQPVALPTCDGKIFCMGDRAGCVQARDCELLVAVELGDFEEDKEKHPLPRTVYKIFIREPLGNTPSNKKALVWASFNADPPRKEDKYPVEAFVPFADIEAKDPIKREFLYENKVLTSANSAYNGIISGRMNTTAPAYTFVVYGYYLKYHNLTEDKFAFNDAVQEVYVHAVLLDSSNSTVLKKFRSDKLYLLSNFNGTAGVYPTQVGIKDYLLSVSPPNGSGGEGNPGGNGGNGGTGGTGPTTGKPETKPSKGKLIAIIVGILVAVIVLLIICYFAYERFKNKSSKPVDGGVTQVVVETQGGGAPVPIVGQGHEQGQATIPEKNRSDLVLPD